MRMSIWQFLGLLALLAGLYVVYNYWWVNQDRGSWINKLNDHVYESKSELDVSQQKTSKDDSNWP